MTDDRDCGRDVAAYALSALDGRSAEAFRVHMEACIVCRDELSAFEEVTEMLAASPARYQAPRRLRRRVMRAVVAESRAASAQRITSARPWLAVGALRPAHVSAVMLVALAIVVSGLELRVGTTTSERVYRARIIGEVGAAELRVTGKRGELVVSRPPAPRPGRIYEVWITRPRLPPTPTSALFSVTAAGAADVEVPGDLHGATGIMVTEEPADGSQVPTRVAVLRANLS